MIDQMLKNNPGSHEINEYIKKNNGDLEKAFYAAAKDKGVDPNEILKQLM